MRDLIVQWLTQITAPFWKSSLSIDQFITALQETFHMVFFAMLFGCIWGFIQAIILLVTRPDGILPNIDWHVGCNCSAHHLCRTIHWSFGGNFIT